MWIISISQSSLPIHSSLFISMEDVPLPTPLILTALSFHYKFLHEKTKNKNIIKAKQIKEREINIWKQNKKVKVLDQKYSLHKIKLHTLSCLRIWDILSCMLRFCSPLHRYRQCSRRLHHISNLAKYNVRSYIGTRLELQRKWWMLALDGERKWLEPKPTTPSPGGIFKKRGSENVQQIYKRTPMPKCDFNKFAKQLTFAAYFSE